MSPGFWLVVGWGAILAAAFLLWAGDRVCAAIEALTQRRLDELQADADTFGEPTREEVEGEW